MVNLNTNQNKLMLVYGLFRRVRTWSWSHLQGDTDTDESDSNWLAASAHLQYGQNKSALAVAEDYGKNDTHTGEKMTRDTKLNWHHKLPETSQKCSPAGLYQYNLMSESLKHQQTSFLIFLKETAEFLLAVLNLHLCFSFRIESQQEANRNDGQNR